MKYVFAFNEINYGRIEIEADHKPDNGEIIEKILERKADYSDTDFTDFRLVEKNGEPLINDDVNTEPCGSYSVTITETLQKVVTLNADSPNDAEQTASDNWRAGDYILDAENFIGVEFSALPAAA